MSGNRENLYLIGMMGSGKTTIGELLANKLEKPFIDLDSFIENEQDETISNIFSRDGETQFRNLETEALKLASGSVVACGGGVVLRRDNRAFMRSRGIVILLTASVHELSRRVKSIDSRPLLNGPHGRVNALEQLWGTRRTKYIKTAHLFVDTEGLTPKDIAEKIICMIGNENN